VYTYLNIQGNENNLDIFENNAAKFAISQDDITHIRSATELAINQFVWFTKFIGQRTELALIRTQGYLKYTPPSQTIRHNFDPH